MVLGQQILDRITAQGTVIDGVIELIKSLAAAGDITPEVAEAINAKLAENDTKLEAALVAGTTPPDPEE
jgi:hypothetical protein